jgi:hypothetical protein
MGFIQDGVVMEENDETLFLNAVPDIKMRYNGSRFCCSVFSKHNDKNRSKIMKVSSPPSPTI